MFICIHTKAAFALGGILRAERNFSLSCDFSGVLVAVLISFHLNITKQEVKQQAPIKFNSKITIDTPQHLKH